jgi:hypothetical protein
MHLNQLSPRALRETSELASSALRISDGRICTNADDLTSVLTPILQVN